MSTGTLGQEAHKERRRHLPIRVTLTKPRSAGLLIAGGVTLIGAHLATALFAAYWAAIISSDCDYQYMKSCDGPGLLVIPIVGPWLAPKTEGFGPAFGVAQAVGLVLTIAGVLVYDNSGTQGSRAAASESAARGLLLSAAPLPGGAVVGAALRF